MKELIVSVICILFAMNMNFIVPQVSAQINDLERNQMCEALEDIKLKEEHIISAMVEPAEGNLP